MSTQYSIAQTIGSVVNQPDSGTLSSRIVQAIKNAADKTGVDFSYLLKKASQESSFDANAKSSTSSATGLYQFTGQTWLQMVKTYGSQYGLSSYASQISTDATGHLSVSDPTTKKAILALRNDPTISAEMAGELDKENASSLQSNVGGKIGGTELYLAHFLGAGGASDFITALRENPAQSAASVLPTAASANPSVFYTKEGQPRSLQQIYQHFAQKFNSPLQNDITTQVASAAPLSSSTPSLYSTISTTTGGDSKQATIAALSSIIASNVSPAPHSNALYSTMADATPTNSGLRATTGAGGINLNGSSTLFAAMVLGQMNGIESDRARETLGQSDIKNKDAVSALSDIA